jgi:hypothetical protein
MLNRVRDPSRTAPHVRHLQPLDSNSLNLFHNASHDPANLHPRHRHLSHPSPPPTVPWSCSLSPATIAHAKFTHPPSAQWHTWYRQSAMACLEAPDRQPGVVSTNGGGSLHTSSQGGCSRTGAQACWPLEARGNSSYSSYTSLLSFKNRKIKNCFENSKRWNCCHLEADTSKSQFQDMKSF